MDTSYLITLYIISCTTTWVFLGLFYVLYTSGKRLRGIGYSSEYIRFLKKDYRKRSIGIAVGIPVLLFSAYSIYWLIAGVPETYDHLLYIFVLFLILILPFPIMDIRKNRIEYKKMAIETQAEIIIDMRHKVLHRIFNPLLELIFILAFLVYYFTLTPGIPPMVYIHLLIPWLIYFSARGSKFLTKPLMKDGYLMLVAVNSINYLIVLYYLFRYGIKCAECSQTAPTIVTLVLMIFLMLKILYSVYQFLITRKLYLD